MAKYWEKRAIVLERLLQDRTDETIIMVNKLFEQVFDEINLSIEKILVRFTEDGKISLEDALELMNEEQTKKARKALFDLYGNCMDAELKREIENRLKAPAYAARIRRLEALRDIIYYEAKQAGAIEEKMIEERLIDCYAQSYYHTTYDIQQETGCGYDFNKLTNPGVKATIAQDWKGSNYSERVWKDTEKVAETAQRVVEKGLLIGQSGKHMAEEIMQNMQEELEKTKQNAQYVSNRLVRTEVANACAQGRKLSYEAAGIKKYIFIATLDLRTSKICASLDHKVFLVSEAEVGKNFPPMHPNCRSVDGAYVEERDLSKLKRRAKDPKTGKSILVPAGMTYPEWYEKYVAKSGKESSARTTPEQIKRGEKSQKKQYIRRQEDKEVSKNQNVKDVSYKEGSEKYVSESGKGSGARTASEWIKRDKKSKDYYESIRKREDDVAKIANYTGMPERDIRDIKKHVFYNSHIFDNSVGKFDADYDMAVAWQRLINGIHEDRDIVLLKHELLESRVEKEYNLTYREAHKIAEEKYAWDKMIDDLFGGDGESVSLDELIRKE